MTPNVHPLHHWLSVRVRLLCGTLFIIGAILPPYVPRDALAFEGDEEVDAGATQVLLVEDGFLLKSSSLTQQGARRAYAKGLIHVVEAGENLENLAERYGISIDTIRWANSIEPGSPIRPDQELIILPVDGVLHTVKRGQTLTRIAELYGLPSVEIAAQNGIEGDFILAGQELIIPGGKPIVTKGGSTIAARPPEKKPSETVFPPTSQKKPAVSASPTPGVLQMPCNACAYTQYFHPGHYGVDIQTKGGGPIFAAEDGVVIRADMGWNGGYGNVIEIGHGNGLVTLYAHNKELYVAEGETVKRGQAIAWMGNTGRVYGQTGIHIHFEVHIGGLKKNPLLYLQ
jgi:LysM repeat protein